MKLTKAQRRSIVDDVPIDGFTIVDRFGVDLGRDNYRGDDFGVDMYLAVIKRESDGQLFGVPWGNCSDDYTIGDYDEEQINGALPIILLWANTTTKTIVETVTVYEGGKSLLNELDLQF